MRQLQSAAERAYEEIKRRVIAGRLGAGRIDLQRLADALRMSQTPVREALARLAAERLVDASPGYGYAVVLPTARQLRQLYDWSGELADLALSGPSLCPQPSTAPSRGNLTAPETYAEGLSALLCAIAASADNAELLAQTRRTGERLYQARLIEPSFFAGALKELQSLEAAWVSGEQDSLRAELKRHHGARAEAASVLSEALAASAETARAAWS
ncbi:MAG TPA: GntR family transcriptional regulator [Vitreimonas sp.]|uniref:GntR family transcriptional regulator n=1 Tax=Vitreimonas sp. TaxID=3069702 RepID=UPI002D33703B|nr:GntR family transcriptional regulator [Vitreimonas sp.]HYD86059.1 GntR family transcriptional regulator [Vitreimonas sp.]